MVSHERYTGRVINPPKPDMVWSSTDVKLSVPATLYIKYKAFQSRKGYETNTNFVFVWGSSTGVPTRNFVDMLENNFVNARRSYAFKFNKSPMFLIATKEQRFNYKPALPTDEVTGRRLKGSAESVYWKRFGLVSVLRDERGRLVSWKKQD